MGVLEDITQMQSQGMQDNEIVANLQERGVDPKSINDAFSQSQIKSAVTAGEETMPESTPEEIPGQQMQSGPASYAPRTQEISEESYAPQEPQQNYYSQGYNQEAGYDDYGGEYENNEGMSTDNFVEIAEQVFSEKNKLIQKQIDQMNEFKTLAQVKIDQNTERIKRIEEVIDKLQISILGKVGTYGNSLEGIKREMTMMQDSFGKIVPSLAQKHSKTHTSPKKTTSRKK
ncbi:hypothetical protein ISS08_02335 [Candidatus Pacearchaeota archaeon]|nr:hypothetical protein [Candidatus Pacearchaeota archaeon]